MTNPGNRGDGLRIGDAERQRAADSLADHFAAGRLDSTEFEERTGAAWRATTVGELKPLFFDLPGGSLDGYVAHDSTARAERSANVPAAAKPVSAPQPRRDRRTERREARGGSSVVLRVLMATIPMIALILFFVLNSVGFDHAWLAFLLIPIVYMGGGAIARANSCDDEDDSGDEGDHPAGGRDLPRPPAA